MKGLAKEIIRTKLDNSDLWNENVCQHQKKHLGLKEGSFETVFHPDASPSEFREGRAALLEPGPTAKLCSAAASWGNAKKMHDNCGGERGVRPNGGEYDPKKILKQKNRSKPSKNGAGDVCSQRRRRE